MKVLVGKTAFVTGAASGIGLGIAGALAQAGAKVMLCDIEEAALAKAVEGLKRTNADVDGVKADVSLKSELKAAADDRPFWQGAHPRQQCGRRRRRILRRVDRGRMELDARRQFDGCRMGRRDFRPANRTAWRGRTHRLHSLRRGADLPWRKYHVRNITYNVSKYGVVALSEGLRDELAQRGIGVSVLCPGFVRTQIMDSLRNLPERFDRPSEDRLAAMRSSDMFKWVQERVSHGIDPFYVGELVREGIENDWPYIFTDVEFEPLIEGRFAAIKQGFDRIRGREPRR